ncbi:MAG TPA: hypothetical protein VGE01_07500, partial [Fimbriimonas sp.]
MAVIHQPKQPVVDARMLVFPVLGSLLFGALFFRLWYIQVVKAEELTEKAEASRVIKVDKLAPRGLMFDRRGNMVAGVKSEIVVTAVPVDVRKNPEVLDRVAQILGVDRKRLQEKV